jgi:hypothetical protein
MLVTTAFASVLDSLQDVSSIVLAVLAFGAMFLLLEGFDRV